MATIYGILIIRFVFKYETVFTAKIDKQDEDNEVLVETELFNNLNKNQNLTESDIENIDIKSPLEQQIPNQGRKDSG